MTCTYSGFLCNASTPLIYLVGTFYSAEPGSGGRAEKTNLALCQATLLSFRKYTFLRRKDEHIPWPLSRMRTFQCTSDSGSTSKSGSHRQRCASKISEMFSGIVKRKQGLATRVLFSCMVERKTQLDFHQFRFNEWEPALGGIWNI